MYILTQQRNSTINLNKGFTVVETLVAILVLSITIAGPLSIAFSGLRGAQLSKDEVTASYLAQEGIEYVRAMRDQDYIDGGTTAWATFLTSCVVGPSAFGCWIDTLDFAHGTCTNAACTTQNPVEFNTAGTRAGLYEHGSTGTFIDTRFTRIVTAAVQDIASGSDTDEYLITSTVSWKTGTIDRSVVIRETITNWQKNL
jgi:prepilin-type N-terminal cleavage/methylation domain-containing protein